MLAPKARIRRGARNILFIFLVFCAFLLALEMTLRATHLFGASISPAQPCPILGWRYSPGHTYWFFKENDHPITGRMNRYGWRDKEWSEDPGDGYRVAVLGDSYVEGVQVESERTFEALTEQRLREAHHGKVELMNFGRSAATQTEELLILQDSVDRFSPDMVILCFNPHNDIRDVARTTAANAGRPFFNVAPDGKLVLDVSFRHTRRYRLRVAINHLRRHSALVSLLSERYSTFRATRARRTGASPDDMPAYLSLCTNDPNQTYWHNYRLCKTLVKAMAEYCRENGIAFMLVCQDTEAYLPDCEKRWRAMDATFNAFFFEDDLRDYAASLGVEYLGLQRVFRESYLRNRVPLHWGHWNYDGHRVVADALANKLWSFLENHAGKGSKWMKTSPVPVP
jgi:hypothetical protein